jgi:hypothetical protein
MPVINGGTIAGVARTKGETSDPGKSYRDVAKLPQLVTNWTAVGEPGGSMLKLLAIRLFPVLTAGILVVFAAVPRIDPLRENIQTDRRPHAGGTAVR